MRKRVVLLGKGVLAVHVANWLHDSEEYELLHVVPNNPPSNWTLRLEDWAKGKNVEVIKSGRVADVSAGAIELAISVTYDKILKPDWIARCTKAINIHNAPLPEYRGVNPINWALKNGETEHGVTIHEISTGIDDGPIVAITRFPINPAVDEVIDVYDRCINFGWKLFKETMPNLWTITPQPQDPTRARYYSGKAFAQLGERSFFTREESRKSLGLAQ
ncbi:Formyl transferase [Rhizobiales bacterium GAS188]|nr:Formyl transferase [Rhizobiales bacterium GAS188]